MGYWDRLGEGFCDPLGLGSEERETAGFLLHDGNETLGRDVGLPSACLLPWEEWPLD